MVQPKTSLIITTIGSFDRALHEYGILCAQNNIDFIIIGDKKTKPDLLEKFTRERNEYKIAGEYYPIDKQEQSRLTILKYLPYNHYARKNIGYLLAMKNHTEVILETDDDNYPQDNFRFDYCKEIQGCLVSHSGWVNVYRYFSDQLIWPRGFPLDQIKHNVPELNKPQKANSPIQQYLANKNPDVDAIYRLVFNQETHFKTLSNNIVLDKFTWCPFNSQNTIWFTEAFPLLYLPSTCSFRMTDIFRSYIAQRILWTFDAFLSFGNATVYQERNEHNLMHDFKDEISGYLNDNKIIELLTHLDLKTGSENIFDNMITCYKILVANNVLEKSELPILDAWINDCHG